MIIVADTGAIVGLIDRTDKHHEALRALFQNVHHRWILPWAILPEVDYLIGGHVGARAQNAFHADLSSGAFEVSWGDELDLDAAQRLVGKYASLRLGLVDAVVIATAVRLRAKAIATLDLRHFAAVQIPGAPKLVPRDDL